MTGRRQLFLGGAFRVLPNPLPCATMTGALLCIGADRYKIALPRPRREPLSPLAVRRLRRPLPTYVYWNGIRVRALWLRPVVNGAMTHILKPLFGDPNDDFGVIAIDGAPCQ